MTKKIALAVLASSLLFACGGKEKDDDCILDEAAACAGKQCGSVSVKDSCGESHNLTCGSCTGDDETCQNNMCVSSTGPTCEVSEEKKAEVCKDKCGTLQTYDTCNNLVDVACGTDCGEGNVCNERLNTCMSEAECLLSDAEKSGYCTSDSCGAAGVLDKCDRPTYFDCAGIDNAYEPLNDFAELFNADGNYYAGKIWGWDAAGKYKAILAEIEEDPANVPENEEPSSRFVAVIFKSTIKAGAEVKVTPLGLDGNSFVCDGDVCVLIANNIAPDYYYYTAVDGTVTVSADKKTFEVKDAHLADMMEQSCYLKAADFKLFQEPRDCSAVDPMADFADNLVEDESGDYYVSEPAMWNEQYRMLITEVSQYVWAGVIFKSTLSATDKEYDVSPLSLDSEGHGVCSGDVCVLASVKDGSWLAATSGKVTLKEQRRRFEIKDAVFTDVQDEECITGKHSFILWNPPADCTDAPAIIAADFANAKIDGDSPVIIDSDASIPDDASVIIDDDASTGDEDANTTDNDASIPDDASVIDDDASIGDEDAATGGDEGGAKNIIARNTSDGVNTYAAITDKWNDSYDMLIVPGATSNHSFWIVYKANADFSSPLALSSVSVNSNYQFVLESGTQAAILAMNNVSGDAGYYYTSSKGTVTIKKEGSVVTAEIRDAFFTDLMDDMCKLAETGMSMDIKSVSEAEYCTFMSPLGDFQDALDSDEAVGYNIKWDEEGVFGVAAVDGINAYVKSEKDYEDNSLNVVFRNADLAASGATTLTLAPLGIDENYDPIEPAEGAFLLIEDVTWKVNAGKLNGTINYYYTAESGSVTITPSAAATNYSVENAEIVDMLETDTEGAYTCRMGTASFSFDVPVEETN